VQENSRSELDSAGSEDQRTIAIDSVASVRITDTQADDKAVRRMRAIGTVVFIILILLIFLGCGGLYALMKPGGLNLGGTNQGGITWIRSIYGHGDTFDELINPTSVHFSPDGDSIWITDSSRFRLVEYSVAGKLKRIIEADRESNGIIFPSRIAISPNGMIYVAQQTYDQVLIFSPDWTLQRTLYVEYPTALAASNNMLLVGSRTGFAAFTADGDLIGMKGVSADEVDTFDFVSSLALDSNDNAYVLDTYRNRYLKYDNEGDLMYEVLLGHPGNEGIGGSRDMASSELDEKYSANLQVPQGLCLDGAGHVFIIDMFDFSVAAFDAETGDFIDKFGVHGERDGSFYYPNDIHYNPQLDMFASAEATLGRVQLFSMDSSSGNLGASLRRQLGDFLSACCIPLLIILLILVVYYVTKLLAKRRQDGEILIEAQQEREELDDPGRTDESDQMIQ